MRADNQICPLTTFVWVCMKFLTKWVHDTCLSWGRKAYKWKCDGLSSLPASPLLPFSFHSSPSFSQSSSQFRSTNLEFNLDPHSYSFSVSASLRRLVLFLRLSEYRTLVFFSCSRVHRSKMTYLHDSDIICLWSYASSKSDKSVMANICIDRRVEAWC